MSQLTLLRRDAELKAVSFTVNIPDKIEGKKKRLFLNRLAATRSRNRNKHCQCAPAPPRPSPCATRLRANGAAARLPHPR